MATVTRENIGNLHDKITVKLSKEDYWPSFEKSLKQYAKQANVPGFRKGMVPAGMVRKMYGQSLFGDEVVKNASRHLENFLNSEKLAIFGQPLILPQPENSRLDMNAPADVDFAFEIGIKPDFSIPALDSKKTFTRYKVEVTDKMIDDEVLRIARRYGKVENPETVEHKENLIYATYQVADAMGNIADDAAKTENTSMLEALPAKLQEELMGKKAGDSLLIQPSAISTAEELPRFVEETLKTHMSNAENHYEMVITQIGVMIPRDLDVLLFAEVFPNDNITTEADFRAKVKTELEREYDNVATRRLNDEIYETLVHETPIELPVPFLRRWMKEGEEKRRTDAEVEREFPAFDHQLRWTIISDKIISENHLQVSPDEVLNDVKGRVLAYFGMEAGEEAPWMDGYMQKIAKDEKTMNETYRQLVFNKLFDFLQQKVTIEEKPISEEEFFKAPPAGHHHHH